MPESAPRLAFGVKRSAIFIHRWLGVVSCGVFLLCFPSGIGMMYWSYPNNYGPLWDIVVISCSAGPRCASHAQLSDDLVVNPD